MKGTFLYSLVLASISGLGIAWFDSRPNWDDTGISFVLILIVAFVFGLTTHSKTWLIALSICIWIPVFSLISNFNFESLLALIPGFAGAFAGFLIRKISTKA